MSKDTESVAITIRLDKAMHKRGKLALAELGTSFKALLEAAIERAEREIAQAKGKEPNG